MNRQEKHLFWRILLAGALFALALPLHLLPAPEALALGVFLAAYAAVGYDVLALALRNIRYGQIFDENFLMALASLGAFLLGEYPEGTAVMLFYQVGELVQSCAVSRSRRSIAALMDIRPDSANLVKPDGSLEAVDPETLAAGDLIVIRPGERVPLDGIVVEGGSSLDTSALTGEAAPRDVLPGDEVISGCVNQTGRLTVRVLRPFAESTVTRILELVENASDKKSRSERFITRFARYYTPAVVLAAALLAVLPPLLLGQPFALWAERALIFLVVSCPCALVISVPMSFFGGIGGASRRGILIKGGNYLEALATVDTVVFDKTGTLTEGRFFLSELVPAGGDPAALLELAACAESASNHPIARSILAAYGDAIDPARLGAVEELPGLGMRAVVDGRAVLAGNGRLMATAGLVPALTDGAGTVVHLAAEGVYAGYLRMEDAPKADAARAVAALKAMGVRRTVMLTGDVAPAAEKIAAALGLDELRAGLLPGDKVAELERIMAAGGGTVAYVGDGVNDAPVLARADVGIAMGGLGSDAAIEAADVVLMTDEPAALLTAIRISRKTLRIARQNIALALGVKAVVLVLGALGLAGMWAAVFSDVGVCVLAVLNALRVLRG